MIKRINDGKTERRKEPGCEWRNGDASSTPVFLCKTSCYREKIVPFLVVVTDLRVALGFPSTPLERGWDL